MSEELPKLRIGVLAIQGAVEEHMTAVKNAGGVGVEIREPQHIIDIDGIILPGGESTTMAIVGEECGLFPVLRDWVKQRKPIWGTCAGMILLSDFAIKQKNGGQALLGGLDVEVCRNYFGSQIHSCAIDLAINPDFYDDRNGTGDVDSGSDVSDRKCSAVFIRAPAIVKVGAAVKVLATIRAKPHPDAYQEVCSVMNDSHRYDIISSSGGHSSITSPERHEDDTNASGHKSKRIKLSTSSENENGEFEVAVAVEQDNILATAFHPELTPDTRWHRYFLDMVKQHRKE